MLNPRKVRSRDHMVGRAYKSISELSTVPEDKQHEALVDILRQLYSDARLQGFDFGRHYPVSPNDNDQALMASWEEGHTVGYDEGYDAGYDAALELESKARMFSVPFGSLG